MKTNLSSTLKKLLSVVISLVTLITLFSVIFTVNAVNGDWELNNGDSSVSISSSAYFELYNNLKNFARPLNSIELDVAKATNASDLKTDENGVQYVTLDEEHSLCEWNFYIDESGVYNIENFYRPTADYERDIVFSITIDGKLPFDEAAQLTLPRIYKCNYKDGDYPFEKNKLGDDIRPEQVQAPEWTSAYAQDPVGLYDEPYLFYLEAGSHTICYQLKETAVQLSKIKICNKNYIKYEEYLSVHSDKKSTGTDCVIQEAEVYDSVTNKNIYVNTDKSDAATSPSDPKNTLLNTVGGSGWAFQGDSVSWTVGIKEAGLYRVVLRARQNINSGLFSYRTLKINGEIPFEEAKALEFEYSQDWKIHTLGTKEGLILYLEPGDVLTLSVTTGEASQILRSVQSISDDLTAIYRQVIAITSATPDIYQDYKLEDKIPDLETNLNKAYNQMTETYDNFCEILGTKGSLASSLKYAAENVKNFAIKPYEIPERLSAFNSTIETLGSLISSVESQPLEMDYIAYLDLDAEMPNGGVGIFKAFYFALKQFIYSFTNDYGIVSSDADVDKTVKVWVSTGRDQAQILSEMINSEFTQKYGVGVELSLVDTSTTLLRASLAGKGPDVALMVGATYPVELAARGAVLNLSEYIDEGIKNEFHESSLIPFYYNGGLYALPETQSFPVIFYRKDIFEQLGISVPNTWEEFYEVMSVIQSNNLAVGLPEVDSANYAVSASLNIFESLLVQKGGMFYVDDLSKTQFDTESAYEAFTEWSKIYTNYGIARELSFYNRFRTGEVPFAIRGIGEYLQIKVAAPEINGKWDIAPIPGTLKENGEVDRSISSSVTGCIVLKAAATRGVAQESADFIQWWVGSEAQAEYGRNLEITLGTAGRYFSANIKAFEKTDWSSHEFNVLNLQRNAIVNQPTIPGSYVVSRDLTSALREVIDGTNRPRRALMLYNSDINEEIARKRQEFELGE